MTESDDQSAAFESSSPCDLAPRIGRVTRVFRSLAPGLLWLALADGSNIGTTPTHQVWTQQAGWTDAARVRPGDTLIGIDGRPVEVIALGIDRMPVVVYNLEIDGTWTYFVHGAWVHNNSCETIRSVFERFLKWSGRSAEHVRMHNVNDLRKRIHGVFDEDGVYAVEEAWAIAQRMGLAPDAKGGINIPMGRIIGWEGGYAGTRQSLDTIRLILSNSLEVITAYPVGP